MIDRDCFAALAMTALGAAQHCKKYFSKLKLHVSYNLREKINYFAGIRTGL